jgi:carbamoyltransferase
VQTVRREENERLYQLLKEFEALTGVPVLLNTSFNVKGEPIVETPDDAMECFLTTGIDVLVMHDLLIEKTKMHGVVNPVLNVLADVRSAVRSGMRAA